MYCLSPRAQSGFRFGMPRSIGGARERRGGRRRRTSSSSGCRRPAFGSGFGGLGGSAAVVRAARSAPRPSRPSPSVSSVPCGQRSGREERDADPGHQGENDREAEEESASHSADRLRGAARPVCLRPGCAAPGRLPARSSYNRRAVVAGLFRPPDRASAMRARLAPAPARRRPARRDRRSLRRHREAEADAQPDRRARSSTRPSRRRATARRPRRRSGSACDGPTASSVEIVDGDGDVVRELARSRPQGRPPVTYVWDGRDDDGRVVDEGIYRPRVHLDRAAPDDRDARTASAST